MRRLLLACAALAALSGPALAVIPVTDHAAIVKAAEDAIRSIEEMQRHRALLERELQTAQNTLSSQQRLTDISSMVPQLNGIRAPFGGAASDITGLLRGQGTGGILGSLLPGILGRNEVYRNPNQGWHAEEQNRRRQAIAAHQAASEKLLGEAQARTGYLEELRERLGREQDPAAKLDLIARVNIEQTHLQNISLQTGAVRDFALAEERSFDQRRRENMQMEIDDVARGLEAERGSRGSRGWLSSR